MNSPSTPTLLPFVGNASSSAGQAGAGIAGEAAAIAEWQAGQGGTKPVAAGMPFAGLLGVPVSSRAGQVTVPGEAVVDPAQIADLAFPSTFVEGALMRSPRGNPETMGEATVLPLPGAGEEKPTLVSAAPKSSTDESEAEANSEAEAEPTVQMLVGKLPTVAPIVQPNVAAVASDGSPVEQESNVVDSAKVTSGETTKQMAAMDAKSAGPAQVPIAQPMKSPNGEAVAVKSDAPRQPLVSRESLGIDSEHHQFSASTTSTVVRTNGPVVAPASVSTVTTAQADNSPADSASAVRLPATDAGSETPRGLSSERAPIAVIPSAVKDGDMSAGRIVADAESLRTHVASADPTARSPDEVGGNRPFVRSVQAEQTKAPVAEVRPQVANNAAAGTGPTVTSSSTAHPTTTAESATQFNADVANASRATEAAAAAQPKADRKTGAGDAGKSETAPTQPLGVSSATTDVAADADVTPASDARRAAEIAADLTREPAVALPTADSGWKKILLTTYKERDRDLSIQVGIKDAMTSGIMSSVMSAPISSFDAAAAVAQTSNSYSSIPAEWAEKLTQLAARAERLAPAKLEVRLPVNGADDLRVQVTCRGGNIRCEFHNASSELQSLFMREWPGLSQLFGKESQLRVEQPNFVNYVERQKNGGEAADQQQQQQRRESTAQREEDEILSAFLATRRGTSRPAA